MNQSNLSLLQDECVNQYSHRLLSSLKKESDLEKLEAKRLVLVIRFQNRLLVCLGRKLRDQTKNRGCQK